MKAWPSSLARLATAALLLVTGCEARPLWLDGSARDLMLCGEQERCNGLDDDCNGTVDDPPICPQLCAGVATEDLALMVCSLYLDHQESLEYCQGNRLELPRLESERENAAWVQATEGLEEGDVGAWLAATREDGDRFAWPEGDAFWQGDSQGYPLEGRYSNWLAGHPSSDASESCTEIFIADSPRAGFWKENDCAEELLVTCRDGPSSTSEGP